MALAIAFSEIDLDAEQLRRIDREFSVFEGTAWLAYRRGLRGRHDLQLAAGGCAAVELDAAFPTLTVGFGSDWTPDDPAPRWRLWRPPRNLLDPADRSWLRDAGFDLEARCPVVVARTESGLWSDPTPDDVATIVDLTARATRQLARRRRRAA